MPVALVLGGGGSKGFAHAGVLAALEDAHIPIHLIVGTSAGSIVGALYADNPNSKALQDTLIKTSPNEILGDFSITRYNKGFIAGNKLQHFLSTHTKAKNFRDLHIPFVAVTTDFQSGKAFPISSGPIAPAVNASAAVPGIFEPVHLYNHILVDGGLINNVPVVIAEHYHPKIIIAVDISEPLSKSFKSGLIRNLHRSYDITLQKLTQEQLADSHAVLIAPDTKNTPLYKGVDKKKLFNNGYKATQKKLPLIKKRLKEQGILTVT